jgi:C-terminal processing protease CtpA/Prc
MRKLILVSMMVLLVAAVAITMAQAKSNKGSAWLGVYCQTVDEDLAEAFDLSTEQGVIINEIVSGSPADEAGMEDGDVIILFNGEKLFDHDDLLEMLEDSSPGSEVKIAVMRDGDQKEFLVTLEKARKHEFKRQFWVDGDDDHAYVLHNAHLGNKVYMGVKLSGLSKQLGDFFGVAKGRGALVTEVIEDSPAETSGIKAGDVITAVDGEKVIDAGDVSEVIEDGEVGDKVEVTIIRDKKEQAIEVTLAEADEDTFGQNWFHSDGDWTQLDLRIPDIDIDFPKIPHIRGLKRLDHFDHDFDFGGEELEEELDELRQELKQMQKELQELKGD